MSLEQSIAVLCSEGYIPKVKKEEQKNCENKKYQYIAPFYVTKKRIAINGFIAVFFNERHLNPQCIA